MQLACGLDHLASALAAVAAHFLQVQLELLGEGGGVEFEFTDEEAQYNDVVDVLVLEELRLVEIEAALSVSLSDLEELLQNRDCEVHIVYLQFLGDLSRRGILERILELELQ